MTDQVTDPIDEAYAVGVTAVGPIVSTVPIEETRGFRPLINSRDPNFSLANDRHGDRIRKLYSNRATRAEFYLNRVAQADASWSSNSAD